MPVILVPKNGSYPFIYLYFICLSLLSQLDINPLDISRFKFLMHYLPQESIDNERSWINKFWESINSPLGADKACGNRAYTSFYLFFILHFLNLILLHSFTNHSTFSSRFLSSFPVFKVVTINLHVLLLDSWYK